MKSKEIAAMIHKAGTSVALAAIIACSTIGCGKTSESASGSTAATSSNAPMQADTSEDSASSDTGTGTDFANVISENSVENESAPTELKVGSLTLEIPGYYSLDTDNGSGDDIDKIYTYEVGDTGAVLEVVLTSASGVSDAEFRDSKDRFQQAVEDSLQTNQVTLTKSQETEYMGMPGYSYDFTGDIDGTPATLDFDTFLDSSTDELYMFRFVKVGEPEHDVASDYGNMMKNATWSGSKTANSTESEDAKDSTPSNTDNSDTAGVDPDLKNTLDSYEKIMNECWDFMEKYENADSSDMVSMLDDYYKMLKEYTDAMDSLSKLDTSNMSTADYKYYLDVTNRVSKRLLEIGQ